MPTVPAPQLKPISQIPGTPPDTPPGSSPPNGSLSPSFSSQLQHGALMSDVDMTWSAYGQRYMHHEPLDLRPPQCADDWFPGKRDGWPDAGPQQRAAMVPKDYHLQLEGHVGPMGPHPPGAAVYISDEELVNLSVRDLNRRLHNTPKEVQTKFKQKRRTLKNRGYAQNCRFKRQNYKQELESKNRDLQTEMQRMSSEYSGHLAQVKAEMMSLKTENLSLKRELECNKKALEKFEVDVVRRQLKPEQQQQQQQQLKPEQCLYPM